MTYRRSRDKDIFSSRWRSSHRSELLECGVPSDVAGDDRRWSYVLLHGNDHETGWAESWLTDQQAEWLLELLNPHLPDPTGIDLVMTLQRRCAKPDRSR